MNVFYLLHGRLYVLPICHNKDDDDEPTCTPKTSVTCSVEHADRQGVPGVRVSRCV